MSDNYTDLDALVPTDKTVKLGEVDYKLPGDLPLEIFVRINKASDLEDDEGEVAALNEMLEAMGDLFAFFYEGKPEYDSVRQRAIVTLRSRGLRFNMSIIQNIYREDEKPAEEPTEGKDKS